MGIKALLTDIEGTITSLRFVHEVLFPYARKNLAGFIRKNRPHSPRISQLIEEVLTEAGQQKTFLNETEQQEAAIKSLLSWMDQDLKATPLKELQGLIWEAGYQAGCYQGHIYPDAYDKFEAIKREGTLLYVYSSGSVKAQRLLFEYSCFGNMLPFFSGFFDTHTGNKKESSSYKKIAAAIHRLTEEILFLSDSMEELSAAEAAGMNVIQIRRKQDYPEPNDSAQSRFTILEDMTPLKSDLKLI